MKDIDTNHVIAIGLSLMGVLSVIGWIVYTFKTGSAGGTEIPLAIGSGMAGVLTGKSMAARDKMGNEVVKDENIPEPRA